MNKILSYIGLFYLKFIVLIFSITPFWLIYMYSTFLSFLLFNIFGYRTKVVKANLKLAFPEKSDIEINQIAKKFYNHLSDLIFESLKGFSISEKEIVKRFKFENPEIIDYYFDKKQNIICVGGHHSNWEWALLSAPSYAKPFGVFFYKPLNNKIIDSYVRKNRTRFGSYLEPIKETTKVFDKYINEVFVMIADQSPSNLKNAIWTKFLGINTPVLHGVEKHAKRLNLPVIYMHFNKHKRGSYSLRFELITETPNETVHGEISKTFMKKLEEDIYKAPECWLWSHKRWKRVPKKHLKGDFPTDL